MIDFEPKTRLICALLALSLVFAPLAVYAQDEPAVYDPAPAAGSAAESTSEEAAPATEAAEPGEVAVPDAARPDEQVVGETEPAAGKEPAEKPEAAVTLTITADEFKAEESRAALDWSLRGKLEESYRLMDPKRVGDLEHQAATATEKENCTSESCLRTLKRRLITDRLFAVSIAPEAEFTQVHLTLLTRDDKILRSEVCSACTLDKLQARMLALLDELIVADLAKPDLNAVADSIPLPPKDQEMKDEGFSLPWWAYVAAGVLALAALGGGGGGGGADPGAGGGDSGSVGVSW